MNMSLLLTVSLAGGCASIDSPADAFIRDARQAPVAVTFDSVSGMTPGTDEIRVFDSRVLRSLCQSDVYENAIFLNGPQKKAIIIGGSIVGAYLISEWIEDEVAFSLSSTEVIRRQRQWEPPAHLATPAIVNGPR